ELGQGRVRVRITAHADFDVVQIENPHLGIRLENSREIAESRVEPLVLARRINEQHFHFLAPSSGPHPLREKFPGAFAHRPVPHRVVIPLSSDPGARRGGVWLPRYGPGVSKYTGSDGSGQDTRSKNYSLFAFSRYRFCN